MEDEAHDGKAAFNVPEYLRTHGFVVVPVPLKHPDAEAIAGQKAYHRLTDVPGDIEVVDVFLTPARIDEQLTDLLAKHPKMVWFQQGIRNDQAAEQLARAGIQIVRDKCIMKAHMAYQARAAHRPGT